MKMKTLPLLGMAALCLNTATAQENITWNSNRPDSHAPISIMGDHSHQKGEIMLSYRYMPMWMSGNRNSDGKIADDAIYQNYMTAPQKMQMNMHMLGVMYAPSDRLTLMVMGNYITNNMDLTMRMMGMNTDFSTQSSGFGDMSVSGIVKILDKNQQSLLGNLGISIPTGNIDQRGTTPMAEGAILGYPMQLGSGTWDPTLGITYLGQSGMFSWGLQPKYKFRVSENTKEYTLGNQLNIAGWGAVNISRHLSFSTSLSYYDIQKIKGANPDMRPMMMPLFNTANTGRSQLDLGIGTNILMPSNLVKNLRLAAEVKLPIYQKVNGIQMNNTVAATLGVQYVFKNHTH